MREQSRKTVDVLGVEVSLMRPDKAVNITMNYLQRKETGTVFFHTAESSLFCQSQDWAAGCIDSCDLVLPGDHYIEHAVGHAAFGENRTQGHSHFADRYLIKLLARIARENRTIFVVTDKEDYLESLAEDLKSIYPEITLDGAVLQGDSEPEIEALVNDINGIIPDIIFLCLNTQTQLNLFREYVPMMNTHLVVSTEFILPSVLTSLPVVPKWVEALHLTDFYQGIQEKIMGSIFRKTIMDKIEKDDPDIEDKEENNQENPNGEE